MNESLNWNVGSNARFNTGMHTRRDEQERRKAELMEHHRSSERKVRSDDGNVERDWANRVIFKSQRRHVETKNRDSLADLMSSSSTSSSSKTHVTKSRKKQFESAKPLEINLTGPGGRIRNNASSWKTSSQIHQSGMRAHVAPVDRRTSRGTVASTNTNTGRPRPRTTKNVNSSSFSLFDNSMLDAIASRTSRSTSSQKEGHKFKPLPGYTGKRHNIDNPKHHDKSVSVGYHPYGSSYSGVKTKF